MWPHVSILCVWFYVFCVFRCIVWSSYCNFGLPVVRGGGGGSPLPKRCSLSQSSGLDFPLYVWAVCNFLVPASRVVRITPHRRRMSGRRGRNIYDSVAPPLLMATSEIDMVLDVKPLLSTFHGDNVNTWGRRGQSCNIVKLSWHFRASN